MKTTLSYRLSSVVILAAAMFLLAAARPKPAVIDVPKGKWNTNLTSGVRAALKPGTPAMIMLSANWCPDCKRMKKAVFADERVQSMLSGWNTIYIDTDTYPTAMDEFKTKWIPTVVLLDSKGKELSRAHDDMTPDQFVAWANDMRQRSERLAEIDKALEKELNDPMWLKRKIGELAELGMYAVKVDRRVMVANIDRFKEALECTKQAEATGTKIPHDSMIFFATIMEAIGGSTRSASHQLAEFEKKGFHPDESMFWQAAILRFEQQDAATAAKQAQQEPPKTDYAKLNDAFNAYLKKYPAGEYVDQARRMIDTLKKEEEGAQKAAAKAATQKTKEPVAKEK